jgi:tRNA (mo5U34)-methyltransferase
MAQPADTGELAGATPEPSLAAAREAIAANPLWYHTIELAPGVVTPGWFDLRPIVDRLPWPDVAGKRCLDIGTYDGFLAFELERRGAKEVIATDISDHADWDWPYLMRHRTQELAALAGPEKGLGFKLAKRVLGSNAERVEVNVYDLTPERMGTFDVVVCGALLLHLRDPLRALEAVRGVCGEAFLSVEEVRPELSVLHRGRPLAELNGLGELCQWWVPNRAGHQRMVMASGFEIERTAPPLSTAFGPAHPPLGRSLRARRSRLATWLLARSQGLLTSAVLARPQS